MEKRGTGLGTGYNNSKVDGNSRPVCGGRGDRKNRLWFQKPLHISRDKNLYRRWRGSNNKTQGKLIERCKSRLGVERQQYESAWGGMSAHLERETRTQEKNAKTAKRPRILRGSAELQEEHIKIYTCNRTFCVYIEEYCSEKLVGSLILLIWESVAHLNISRYDKRKVGSVSICFQSDQRY